LLLLLDGLAEGLGGNSAGKFNANAPRQAIVRLVSHSSPEVRQRAIRLAGLLQLQDLPELDRIWAESRATAQDEKRPLTDRLTAVSILATASWSHRKDLAALVGPRQPQEMQLSVVQTLASGDQAEVAGTLLSVWSGASPKVQEALLDALFARRDRLPKVLDAIEKRVVPASILSPVRREQLLKNSAGEVRRRARALLAAPSDEERAAVLEKYRSALALKRDPVRGKVVFEQQCAKCHQLHGIGVAVGPDLAAAGSRSDATLLTDILDPSAALTPGYTVYTVATLDGRVFTGALAAETATSITLRREKGESDIILRKNIDEMTASARSLMPDGMEKLITPQGLADLIGFLRQSQTAK
jgi:putative heme-binding domain-containing protein